MVADTPVKQDEEIVQTETHEPFVKHPERLTRTVVHGYREPGRPLGYIHRIDHTVFVDGIARNVPKETAKAWITGQRPEGSTKPYAVDGRASYSQIDVAIFDNDVTEAEIMKALHIEPMSTTKFAQLLKAYSAKDLARELGPVKTAELIESLREANKENQ